MSHEIWAEDPKDDGFDGTTRVSDAHGSNYDDQWPQEKPPELDYRGLTGPADRPDLADNLEIGSHSQPDSDPKPDSQA